MPFKAGDWIQHQTFGVGVITAHEGPYFHIRFVDGAERRLIASFISEPGAPPTPNFKFPSVIPAKQTSAKPSKIKGAAHSFEHLTERFLAEYPQGFEDPKFVKNERDYKLNAATKLQALLSHNEVESLLANNDFAEVCKRARHLASSTNLIFKQELMSLNDSLRSAETQDLYATSLYSLLYSDLPEQERYEHYFSALGQIGCAKWTIATYFPFLASEGKQLFLKPMVAKTMANAVGISLFYQPELNWKTFEQHRLVAVAVQDRLRSAHQVPRDWIDLQSFMYVSWQSSR